MLFPLAPDADADGWDLVRPLLFAITIAILVPLAGCVKPDAREDSVPMDERLGIPAVAGKSSEPVLGRYAGLVVRVPQGEETAGIVVDMSGRNDRFNEGIYVYTDGDRLDHTAGIQIHNVGAADAMHVNIGCRNCTREQNGYTSTGIGIDQWSNGTGFFTFVHGNGRGVDAVLYPESQGAWAGSFRAAEGAVGQGELLHLDNGDNPGVLALNVARGESNLRETRVHGALRIEREVGDDSHAIRFEQESTHPPALDANAGWLRVLDGGAGDAERFLVEAATGNVRFTGHVGAGPDDGTRTTDTDGRVSVRFRDSYATPPLVSCTAQGAFACYVVEKDARGAVLAVAALAAGVDVEGAQVDVLVRGL